MDFLTFSKKAAAYAAEQNISDYELYYQADNTSQVSVLGETVDRLASSSVEGVSLPGYCKWQDRRFLDRILYRGGNPRPV